MTINPRLRHLAMTLFGLLPCVSSAQDVGAICDGQYAAATEMLDSAYGRYDTLYSGGEHWRNRDNVGATIDLYRLWRDLPDQRFRDAYRYQPTYLDNPLPRNAEPVHEILRRSLPIIHDDSTASTDIADRYVIATVADLGTTLGPSPGWWVAAIPDDVLTAGQISTRDLAATDPFIDWLQTALMASDAPWVYAWHPRTEQSNADPMFADLSDVSFDRFEAGQGLEWRVAAAVLAPDQSSAVFENQGASSLASDAISQCSLSPADFAAQSILRLEELRNGSPLTQVDRQYLPSSLYEIAFRNKVMLATRSSYGRLGDPIALHRFVDLAPDTASLAWLNVARTYYATSVEDLIEIHGAAPLDHKSVRALNVLSVEDLLQFADTTARPSIQRRDMYLVAFARLVALQRWDEAEQLTDTLRDMYPDHSERLRTIAGQNWPQDVRMALTALELPEASVWLTSIAETTSFDNDVRLGWRINTKYGMDLPFEMRIGSFLQRDFEVWLRMPHRWGAFRGMRGFSIGALTRAHARRVSRTQEVRFSYFLPDRPNQSLLPFAELIAWDEISLLGPDHGLSRQISMTLINWAGQGSRYSFLRSRNTDLAKSEALRAVVRLGGRNNVTADDGRPIGSVAFSILHARFANSDAARLTPYWYNCSHRCER